MGVGASQRGRERLMYDSSQASTEEAPLYLVGQGFGRMKAVQSEKYNKYLRRWDLKYDVPWRC